MRTPWWIALAGLTLAICFLLSAAWGEYTDTAVVFHVLGDSQVITLTDESGKQLGEISFEDQDQVRVLFKRHRRIVR